MEDSLRELLTCGICQDTATLPVHGTCCPNANKVQPACLLCVRNYLDLNKHHTKRQHIRKSWGGCGCDINTEYNCRYYTHSEQLYQVRDLLGKSTCHNCNVVCETTSELRRHLNGTSTNNDKNGNCKEAYTKCKYCNSFGKRSYIEGYHFNKIHLTVYCYVCSRNIRRDHLIEHYNLHKSELKKFKENIDKVYK